MLIAPPGLPRSLCAVTSRPRLHRHLHLRPHLSLNPSDRCRLLQCHKHLESTRPSTSSCARRFTRPRGGIACATHPVVNLALTMDKKPVWSVWMTTFTLTCLAIITSPEKPRTVIGHATNTPVHLRTNWTTCWTTSTNAHPRRRPSRAPTRVLHRPRRPMPQVSP